MIPLLASVAALACLASGVRGEAVPAALLQHFHSVRDERALERELPEARFTPPSGGYFMWVELPDEIDVAELEPAAKERGVVFVKGTDFLLEGGANTLRLAYSGVTPEEIDTGITRLAEAVHSLGVTA